mmetsp:Transcript_31017/g.77708  ORF Transcript_31017/g.77708 Transcript_31017/m.77708 type:complete len:289 (+) Transcript_31017:929-1795(+)
MRVVRVQAQRERLLVAAGGGRCGAQPGHQGSHAGSDRLGCGCHEGAVEGAQCGLGLGGGRGQVSVHSGTAHHLRNLRHIGKRGDELRRGHKAAERGEVVTERDRHLGLVVGVLVDVWRRGVQGGGAPLVGVRLDRERRLDGQHLEKEGQVVAKAGRYLLAHGDDRVCGDPVAQGGAAVGEGGGPAGVCPHPQLRVAPLAVHRATRGCHKARHLAVLRKPAPRVVLRGAAERYNRGGLRLCGGGGGIGIHMGTGTTGARGRHRRLHRPACHGGRRGRRLDEGAHGKDVL